MAKKTFGYSVLAVVLIASLLIGGLLAYFLFPQVVEKEVIKTEYKDKIVYQDKIVYKDKIVEKVIVSEKLTCAKGSIPMAVNYSKHNTPSPCALAHNRSAC